MILRDDSTHVLRPSKATLFCAAGVALCATLLFWPATAMAQTFPPINNHSPEFVSHTNNDSVYYHGSLSPYWSAAAVSYWEAGTPTDYDLGLHETQNGNLVASSELGSISELIVIDGNNVNAGNDYYLQVYHYSGQGGEYVEVSNSATTQAVNLGQNDLTVPAYSIVRCFEVYLEAGREYDFEMQSAQQQPVEAYGFLYAPTVGWSDYYDNLMGDEGFQFFGVDLDQQFITRTISAPVDGYYAFVVLLLHEVGSDTTYWIDVYDVTPPPGGGGPSPSISVSPTSLTFNATEGGANPVAQSSNLQISNGPVTWTASSAATWLSVSPNSGTDSGTVPLQVSVNTSGLAAGMHSATITVDAGSVTGSPQTISVTLNLSSSSGGGGGGSGSVGTGSRSCASGIQQGAAPLALLLTLMLLTLAVLRRRAHPALHRATR